MINDNVQIRSRIYRIRILIEFNGMIPRRFLTFGMYEVDYVKTIGNEPMVKVKGLNDVFLGDNFLSPMRGYRFNLPDFLTEYNEVIQNAKSIITSTFQDDIVKRVESLTKLKQLQEKIRRAIFEPEVIEPVTITEYLS